MIILTPNPDYEFDGRDDSNGGSDKLVVKETWVENVYQIEKGDFNLENGHTGILVDIGANIGAVSVFATSLDDNIKVFAYEPESDNFELLQRNLKKNRANKQVSTIKQAVSNFNGVSHITNSQGNSMLSDKKSDEQVNVITLKQVFVHNKIQECDVMKVDVEGAEYQIFTEADFEDLMRIKYLTMEFTNTDAKTYGLLMASLSRAFNLHSIGSYERGGMIYGRRY